MRITHSIIFFLSILFSAILLSCEEESLSPNGNNSIDPPNGNISLHEDEGNVGLVINTRSIVKKRYFPETAEIRFPNHSQFDSIIVIDPSTNLAILSIHRSELSKQDSLDFTQGVAINIMIKDSLQQQLASYSSNNYIIDDSNTPLNLNTNLPFIPHTLYFEESLAYLLQPENMPGFINSSDETKYSVDFFSGDSSIQQQFYFIKVPGITPNTFFIKHLGYPNGEYMYYEEGLNLNYINLRSGDPDEFVLEPDEDDWLRIRHKTTGKFLSLTTTSFNDTVLGLNTTGMRLRIISDVNWEIEDRGTFYNQPIMGRARASFAYQETLENCSQGELQTSVGNSETRSTTWTYSTTESLQLFSSVQLSAGLTVRSEVKAKIGGDNYGKSLEVTVGGEIRIDASYTTSTTTTTQNTLSEQEQKSTEVSRVRTFTVPPYTYVEINDAVKSIDNINVPFTQVLRIRAKDRRNNDIPLSGPEIVQQLLSNLTTGAIKQVRSDYVDITLRGNVKMDRIMHAFTTVTEDTTRCN